jgi:hypothetical protein
VQSRNGFHSGLLLRAVGVLARFQFQKKGSLMGQLPAAGTC